MCIILQCGPEILFHKQPLKMNKITIDINPVKLTSIQNLLLDFGGLDQHHNEGVIPQCQVCLLQKPTLVVINHDLPVWRKQCFTKY